MDKLPFKENIKRYYNEEAELRNGKSVKPNWKIKARLDFCTLVKSENKKTLLEIGAGTGHDSSFFMETGLAVTAVDISSEMVKKCREKSIEAYELDFYNLSLLNRKFDCVYAINTLLHVPQNDLRHVLGEIDAVLDSGGLFYMGVYGGEDVEREYVKSEVSDAPRLFSFYSEKSLKSAMESFFQIISFESLDIETDDGRDVFHSITLRKRRTKK